MTRDDKATGALNLADTIDCLPCTAPDLVDLLGLDDRTARATLTRAGRRGLAEIVGVRSRGSGRPAVIWGRA